MPGGTSAKHSESPALDIASSQSKGPTPEDTHQEKDTAAFSPVLSAVFQIVMKLVMGILTGPLGILSKAPYSAQPG